MLKKILLLNFVLENISRYDKTCGIARVSSIDLTMQYYIVFVKITAAYYL